MRALHLYNPVRRRSIYKDSIQRFCMVVTVISVLRLYIGDTDISWSLCVLCLLPISRLGYTIDRRWP